MVYRIGALNRFITEWCAYFAWAETPSVFAELDRWLRRRLRQSSGNNEAGPPAP
jgi:RNA-directed DNA polymerase